MLTILDNQHATSSQFCGGEVIICESPYQSKFEHFT